MLGAIIGDIVGSPYEFGSEKTKEFEMLTPENRPTDDSLMTMAVGCACVESNYRNEQDFKRVLIKKIREIGLQYPNAGFGDVFFEWMESGSMEAYGGYTNGSAMRVSPVAWVANSLEETERLAKWSAEITHDHPEGIKGAQAVASAIYLARTGAGKEEIQEYIESKYYELDFTLDEIRSVYRCDMTCEGSVPQAIVCFLESEDFEDAIRNAVSLGGDGDTQACIAGAIAEAYYGIPDELEEEIFRYLDDNLKDYYFTYSEELYK